MGCLDSEFKNNYSNESGYKGLHSDIEKSHGDSKYNKEHEKIIKVKDEIIKNILTLKSKQEDIFLFLDKVLFDNTIMMDSIIKNIEMINKYIKIFTNVNRVFNYMLKIINSYFFHKLVAKSTKY